jgi:hypothetical protein
VQRTIFIKRSMLGIRRAWNVGRYPTSLSRWTRAIRRSPDQHMRFCVSTSSTFIATTALMRAKL